jgi:PhnB protein
MPLEAYLNFPGNCREAIEYYARVFNVKPVGTMTFGEMPSGPGGQPMPEETKNLILHSVLPIAGSNLMFSDTPPGMPVKTGNNISLTVVTQDQALIVTAFNALKEGGQVQMELQQTFWSKLYGMVTDKFGIPWQFSLDSGEMRR